MIKSFNRRGPQRKYAENRRDIRNILKLHLKVVNFSAALCVNSAVLCG